MTHSPPSYFCSIPATDIWYPVAPGTTTLPDAPTPTVNASPVPVNAAELPEDWDPAAPDLCYLFQDILPTSAPAVFPLVVTPGSILPPYSETVTVLAVTRTRLVVRTVPYALVLPTVEAALVSRTRLAYVDLTITVSEITYSQSSVLSLYDEPADNASMTNGIFAETTHTGTNGLISLGLSDGELGDFSWIQMDLGGPRTVATVYVGTDFTNTLDGGWGTTYTENCNVEESLDGSTWSVLFNVGTFAAGIQSYTVSTTARYLRIVQDQIASQGYLCVTEFYATST